MFTNLNDSLCNSHNTIMYWVREIKKSLKKIEKDEPELNYKLEDVHERLNDIAAEARIAKKKGQHMENRLKKYRSSIESLGFKRIGKR